MNVDRIVDAITAIDSLCGACANRKRCKEHPVHGCHRFSVLPELVIQSEPPEPDLLPCPHCGGTNASNPYTCEYDSLGTWEVSDADCNVVASGLVDKEAHALRDLLNTLEYKFKGALKEIHEVEQIAGKVLGYPVADETIGADPADGLIIVGAETAVTVVHQLARAYQELKGVDDGK